MGTRTHRPSHWYQDTTDAWRDETGATGTIPRSSTATTKLNDNLDTTYAYTASIGYDWLKIHFDDFTYPALSQIRSVQLRQRYSFPNYVSGDTTKYRVFLGDSSNATNSQADDIRADLFATTAIRTDTWQARTTDRGNPWDNTRVNNMVQWIQYNSGTLKTLRLYEVYADVVYNEAPVATVTAPTEGGTVSNTNRPTVTWTYSDPENDAQERYQIKVFDAAQYGAGGFDPETSTPVWSSGEVLSSVTSVEVGTDLPNNTTYRAYVKVADAGSSARYSYWDYNQFTVSIDPPPAPTLTVVNDNANARNTLTLQGLVNLLTENQASLETDTTGWGGTNATLARDTTQAAHGGSSLSLTATGTSSMFAETGATRPSVVAGKSYTTVMSTKAATAARSTKATIRWWDAASGGSIVGTDSVGTAVTNSTTGWTQVVATATAPTGATHASVFITISSPGGSGEVHYLDKISFAPVGNVNTLDLPGTSGNYASTPDSVANSVTGDIDIRVKVALDDWTPANATALISKTDAGTQQSWQIYTDTTGWIRFVYTTDGSTGQARDVTVATGVADGAAKWIRLTLDVDNGAGGHDVKVYLSDDGVTWTQLGSTVTTTGTTSIFNSTAAVVVGGRASGDLLLAGNVYYAEIRNGIDGTVVAKFDATVIKPTGTRTPNSVVSSTGETWTINGTGWDWANAPGYAGWSRGGLASGTKYVVERSNDGGTTWKEVRGATTAAPASVDSTGNQVVTLQDYEARLNLTDQYRAKATVTV